MDEHGQKFTETVVQHLPLIWIPVKAISWVLWMCLLLFLATLWRDWVDVSCVEVAQWLEQVLVGKIKIGRQAKEQEKGQV